MKIRLAYKMENELTTIDFKLHGVIPQIGDEIVYDNTFFKITNRIINAGDKNVDYDIHLTGELII